MSKNCPFLYYRSNKIYIIKKGIPIPLKRWYNEYDWRLGNGTQ